MNQNNPNSPDLIRETKLQQAFDLADCIVTKNYLDVIGQLKPVALDTRVSEKRIGDSSRVFKVDKLIYDPDEDNLQKLITTYAAAAGFGSSVVMILDSDGLKTSLYLGTCQSDHLTDVSARTKSLYKNFSGNFPGSLRKYDDVLLDNDDLGRLLNRVTDENVAVSCVSGIASERDDAMGTADVQGIEKLIDTMQGNPFSAIFIATLIDKDTLADIKAEYEMLYSRLVPFSGSELSFSEGKSDSVSRTLSTSFSESVTNSRSSALSVGSSHSNAHSTTESTSHSDTIGAYAGGKVGPVALGGNYSHSYSRSHSLSDTTTFGTSNNKTDSTGKSDTKGKTTSDSEGTTESTSTGRSIQIKYENKTVKQLLDRIDLQLERIKESENFGVFAAAAYFTAKDQMISDMAASAYKSLISGSNTHVENARITSWDKSCCEVKDYLRQLRHPVFYMADQNVTPASIVSSKELAIQMGLPQKSVNGISVVKSAAFGINTAFDAKPGRTINIGNLFHMGKDVVAQSRQVSVELDVNSLAMHTFVTGSTGSGKSNAIYMILDKLMNTRCEGSGQNIKFLVVEPAKGEYKDRFGMLKQKGVCVSVYGSNPAKTPLLRINPFSFPEDIHVLEHIDRLTELFNVCWPMYAAMPAVLKESIESAYSVCGWDLSRSTTKYTDANGNRLYPTFSDVLQQIKVVINRSDYSSDSKGDYSGALCTRIKSLTNGLFGQMFGSREMTDGQLFDENVIVDLSRIGSSETKAMIMGLLVIKLQEYRMSRADGSNHPLQHVTVLEEAHNILRSSHANGSGDAAGGLMEKSVEMLSNAIAEMRTYGEGFIIADQSPTMMDSSVIRNTNTKIILRLPDYDDRELVGRAASLNDSQINELSKLPTGVAAVYQNNWTESVLCHVAYNDRKSSRYKFVPGRDNAPGDKLLKSVISYILAPLSEKRRFDSGYKAKLSELVFGLDIPSSVKIEILRYISTDNDSEVKKMRGDLIYKLFNSERAVELSGNCDVDVWIGMMGEYLSPCLDDFTDDERNKILTLILREHAVRARDNSDDFLLSSLVEHVSANRKEGVVTV